MRFIVHVTLLSLLLACPSLAGEVIPFLAEGRVGARIRGLNFPQTLRKELTSGLTSHILARLVLLTGSAPLAERAVEMTLRYDLWDETFRLVVTVDQRVVLDQQFSSLQQVMAFLEDARVPGLFARSEVAPGVSFTMSASVLLNPIDREKMERIREWVAENSVSVPSEPTSPGSGSRLGSSPSNTIFNRIFEQYASGATLSAAWHETAVSKPFRLEGLTSD